MGYDYALDIEITNNNESKTIRLPKDYVERYKQWKEKYYFQDLEFGETRRMTSASFDEEYMMQFLTELSEIFYDIEFNFSYFYRDLTSLRMYKLYNGKVTLFIDHSIENIQIPTLNGETIKASAQFCLFGGDYLELTRDAFNELDFEQIWKELKINVIN